MMNNRVAKIWIKPPDQMDLWLAAQGYYRKHTARDGTCLFRAVSEQLFLTQAFHLEVRRCCIEYGLLHKCLFQKMTKSSIEDRLEKLRCPAESGGYLEINIMSRMYKCDFLLFQEVGKPPMYCTNNGYEKKITLCVAHERHYDSVYSKDHINNAAFCQSLIYETLYKDVFGLLEVDYAVKKMLRDKSSRYQRENSSYFLQHGMDVRLEMRDNCTNVKELLNLGITPFPYKVAKSLDPEIYRNVEYDTWNEYRKGLRVVKKIWNGRELEPGARCLVKLSEGKVFHAFIQEMEPNNGPVLVFIEELGEKRTVPYESLELIPVSAVQPLVPLKPLRLVQNIKVPATQQQQPDSTVSLGKKHFKNGKKISQGSEHKRQSGANVDSTNDSNLTSNAVVSSSDYQQNHDDYQLHCEVQENYQNQAYVTQSCEVTSSVSEVEENVRIESQQVVQPACPPNTLPIYSVNGASDINNNYPSSSVQSYCAVNVLPNRSMLADGSDLPLTDIPAVRYFYNLGLDYYARMNYVMRPDVPTNGSCYPIIQSPAQFIPEPAHISYVNYAYDQSPQQVNHVPNQQMVAMTEGAPVTPVPPAREPVPSSPGVISVASETSSSSHSVSRQPVSSTSSHHVAPRFKNRRKLNNSNAYNKTYNSTPRDSSSINSSFRHNGKYHGTSLVQQPDVSTICNSPVASVSPIFPVPVSHPPPPLPPTTVAAHVPTPSSAVVPPSVPPPPPPLPQTNHYLPIQSSYTSPSIPQTYYFQPVECDSYCPVTVGGYIEYSVVEPPPGIYPTVLSQPQTLAPYPVAPFVTSDGIYYQQIVSSNTV